MRKGIAGPFGVPTTGLPRWPGPARKSTWGGISGNLPVFIFPFIPTKHTSRTPPASYSVEEVSTGETEYKDRRNVQQDAGTRGLNCNLDCGSPPAKGVGWRYSSLK